MAHTLNNPSYTFGNLTVPAGAGVTYASGAGLTYSSIAGDSNWTTNATYANAGGKLNLSGEDADVVINGQSLNETLQAIKDELGIPGRLNRNEKLEQEFAELKEAADRYQEPEKKYSEQKRIFDILKKQDQ